MVHSTFPVSGVLRLRHTPTARRWAGVLALLALMAALPAPVLAAPAEAPSAFSGAIVLDWIQGLLARLGVADLPAASLPEAPASVQERLGHGLDPDGVASYGDTTTSDGSETLKLEDGVATTG